MTSPASDKEDEILPDKEEKAGDGSTLPRDIVTPVKPDTLQQFNDTITNDIIESNTANQQPPGQKKDDRQPE